MIKFFQKIYFELIASKYFKHLFVLTSGVGFSQLIPLLLLPVLTRFFSPTDFGVLAIFMAIIQLIAISTTFRLEMAIVLPKKDTDAALICIVAFFFLATFCFLLFGIASLLWLFIVNSNDFLIFEKYHDNIYLPFYYLIPMGAFLLGLYNILYHWNNRMELYANMSYSHITHSVFSTPLSIVFYFSSLNSIGLILGQIIGRFLACFLLLKNLFQTIKLIPKETIFINIFTLLKAYKKFIVFETPHSILNFISQKYIIGIFSAFFGVFTVGVFDLADKIIGKPLGIISNSFKTVFYKRLTTAKDKLTIFKKSLILMTFISFILTVPFYIIPESFFVLLLGDEWIDTGNYIQLLCPLLFSRFIFNVVTPTISYTMQNHYLLIWQIIYFICLVFLFHSLKESVVEHVLLIYAIFGACMYVMLGFISFKVLKHSIKI